MRELLEHRSCEEDDQLLYPPEEPLLTTWESPPSSAFSSPTSSNFSSPPYSPYASPSPSSGAAMAMPVPSKSLSHIPDMLARMGRGRTNTPPRLAIPQFNVSSLLLPAFNPTRKRKSESDHSPRDPIRLKRAKRVEDRERSFVCPVGSSIYHSNLSTDVVRYQKPGCTKTYLNPNGLKYHMNKGTCVYDSAPVEDQDEAVVVSPTSSSSSLTSSTATSFYASSNAFPSPSCSFSNGRPVWNTQPIGIAPLSTSELMSSGCLIPYVVAVRTPGTL